MLHTIPLLATLLMILSPAWSGELEPDELIRQLARPAPASIAFREVRWSPLLREPVILSGELRYTGFAQLTRIVNHPYREQTVIRGEAVRVERTGEPPRSFTLRRAPELRGLLTGFSALLAGDSAALRRSFNIDVAGTALQWHLSLTPNDARARRGLQRLEVAGSIDQPRCFTTLSANGGATVMLLGSLAELPVPPAATMEKLRAHCAAHSASMTKLPPAAPAARAASP